MEINISKTRPAGYAYLLDRFGLTGMPQLKNSLPPLSSCWFLLIQVKNQHPLQNQCKAGRNSNAGTCPQPKRGFRPANKCFYQNVQEHEKCTGGRNRLLMDKPYE